jgi:hypothetical protein
MIRDDIYEFKDLIFVAILCIFLGFICTMCTTQIIEQTQLETEIGESVCGAGNVYEVSNKQIDANYLTNMNPIYKDEYSIVCIDKKVIR